MAALPHQRLKLRDGKPVKVRPPLTEAVKAGPESPFQKLARRLAEYQVDRPDSSEMLRLLTERPSFPLALRPEPRPQWLADAYRMIAKEIDPATCSLSWARSEAERIMGRSFEESAHRKARRKAGWQSRS
jgi:hypothetical protein